MACLRKPRVRAESTNLDQQKLLSNGDTLERSLPGFLLQEAAQHANSGKNNWMINAVTDEGVSFSDFDRLSRNAASWLCKKGISKGDCVWVSLSASERLHCVLNGVWIANGVVRSAFLEDASTMNEGAVVEKLKELKIKMIFCNLTNAAFYLSVVLKVDWPIYILTNGDQQGCVSLRELFEDDGLDVPALEMMPEDPALMFSSVTSSSTDIVHSHKAVISMIKNFVEFIPFHERPLLISSNLTHVIGVLCPLTLLFSGRTGLMIPKPERRDLKSVSRLTQKYLQKTIDKYQPNAIIGLPYSLDWICKTELMDFSSIEYIYTGGGPKSTNFSQVIKCLPNLKRNVTGYWLKEFGIVACNSYFNEKDGVPLSLFAAGKPLHDISVEIRGIRTKDPVGPNVKGEIVVRSDISSVCKTNKGESAEIWSSTGDLGFLDAHGILHVTDSIQDIIKYKKHHYIFPSEIEDALAQYPGVIEACVLNTSNNDKHNVITAVKVSPQANIDEADLIDFTKKLYVQLDYDPTELETNIIFVEDLPKEKSGKFSRELIALMISGQSNNEP